MGMGLPCKMARTQVFFLPKSQNSQDTHTRGFLEGLRRKMRSRGKPSGLFIGEKKLKALLTILKSSVRSVLFARWFKG